MEIAAILVSLLLAMTLILMGLAKVQDLQPTLEVRDRLGVTSAVWRTWGAWELVAAAALVLGAFAVWKLAVIGGAMTLLSLLVLLALQVVHRERLPFLVPAAGLSVLAVVDLVLLFAS